MKNLLTTKTLSKLTVILSALVLGMLTAGGSASAHVTVQQGKTLPAGGWGTVTLRVPHGCSGEATDTLTVKIPEGFKNIKPQMVPGWTVETEIGEIEPYESHGRVVSEGVISVTWKATGDPLPDNQYLDFGLSVKAPDAPGVYGFPSVQYCGDKEEAWIEGPDDSYPTPTLEVVASSGTQGHGSVGSEHGDEDGDKEDSGHLSDMSLSIEKIKEELEAVKKANASTGTSATTPTSSQGSGSSVALGALGGLLGGILGGLGAIAIRSRKS